MFLPNPGIMAAGAGGGRTYPEFVAHLENIAAGVRTFDEQIGLAPTVRVRATSEDLPATNMFGSPWLSVIRTTSPLARVIQHSLPSEAEFDLQRQEGLWIFLEAEPAGNTVTTAISRNGYTSIAGSLTTARRVVRTLAWIDGRPMQSFPHLGLGPEPYDWED